MSSKEVVWRTLILWMMIVVGTVSPIMTFLELYLSNGTSRKGRVGKERRRRPLRVTCLLADFNYGSRVAWRIGMYGSRDSTLHKKYGWIFRVH
mmetsp:Transcript_15217/g.32746  ORF Transcript_15217/g.32746 Transcript_15217/m.32746 type:complete len:93 (-) Transcript_15217:1031-1309(-)